MKPPPWIRSLSIRHKLTLLLLTPCIVVLLLAGTALFAFQMSQFRSHFAQDVEAVAHIIGANSGAAVSFNDAEAAVEILDSLRLKNHIISAVLILPDGTIFATYGIHSRPPVYERDRRFTFLDHEALMIEPVMLEGRQVATLNVISDYRAVSESLVRLVSWMLVLVVVVGALIATTLSAWLQRLVSDPILRLTRTARAVAEAQDYSIRAHEETSGELAVLTRTFNLMLDRIQSQDEAVGRSQRGLEGLVNSIDGIVWERQFDNLQFTFISRQAERILGFTPEHWIQAPNFWRQRLHPDDVRALAEDTVTADPGRPYHREYRVLAADGRIVWIRECGATVREPGGALSVRGIFLDITAQKTAAAELERLHRQLVETSRQAGMAEVATGVLHNVGNVLNSVCVSATLLVDRLRESRVTNLGRATDMLRDHASDLPRFLADDPKGKVLPEYLALVSGQLAKDQADLLEEVLSLRHNVDHIKEIVAMQQNYASTSGVFEPLEPTELIEDALRINAAAFERHHIDVVRQFAPRLQRVLVDRHKVLQILINLIRNGKYAIDAARSDDKRLIVKVEPVHGNRIALRVKDNGVGIAPENLTRIFQHGFTTKRDGHGFGLHSGANAAREMGGCLSAHSDGLGTGAEFTLEVPVAPLQSAPALKP